MVNVYKAFGQEVPVLDNDQFLTLVGSISALFNAMRFVWSGAIDKIPFRYVYAVLCLLQIGIASTMSFTSRNKTTYMIAICIVLFCVGGHFALFPNIIRQIYGKHACALYGWCFTGTGIASLFIEILVLSKLGPHYILMFSVTGAGSVISLAILILAFDDTRFEPDWVAIFTKSATKKFYKCKVEKNRAMQIEASYHNVVNKARGARMGSLENAKALQRAKKRAQSD